MEEEKTGKWVIVIIVFLILWLLVYFLITKDLLGIRSRYFWNDDFIDVLSFSFSDENDSDGYYWDRWYHRENVPDHMVPVVKWKSYYYADDYDNSSLSKVMKEMKLRATYCPYIFCQTANNDWKYVNLKHYYWDENNEKMILLPNVYYISDCSYYDNLFKQGKLK